MQKAIYLLIGLILGFFLSNLWQWFKSTTPYDNITIEKIYFPSLKKTVFLKKKNWGITGDGQAMVISLSDERLVDTSSQTDFSMTGLANVFYTQRVDTLIIYTMTKFNEPIHPFPGIIVKQVVLENSTFQDLYEKEKNWVKRF
jgi:hypothetical protein